MTRHPYHNEQEDREHHRKHVATWIAAAGTLAVIVALWAVLLPTQLGGSDALGMKRAPAWTSGQAEEGAGEPTSFDEAFSRSQAVLDDIEAREYARAEQEARERAVAEEAAVLRMKLEAIAAMQENAEQKPQ